jgi:SAM-dependent methyltransferase
VARRRAAKARKSTRARQGRGAGAPAVATESSPDLPNALDRFTLYELAAQNPARDAKLLLAVYLDAPGARDRPGLVLGEDFCGTAALSRAWCGLVRRSAAVGVDFDGPTLERARAATGPAECVTLIRADLLTPPRGRGAALPPADVIAVQNFSIGEVPDRPSLVAYLARCRARLKRGGCFVCDVYGGSDAYLTGIISQKVPIPPELARGLPKGTTAMYGWEQRSADPFTGRVVNAMHFEVRPGGTGRGRTAVELHDAFVYHWRLWSVPELRDAMAEAGFARTEVYPRTPGAVDEGGRFHVHPVEDPDELGESFNVYVVGRK